MKKELNAEMKFLELPNDESVLPLLGADGMKVYGQAENGERNNRNHFHNLMEIGICRNGNGEIIFDRKIYSYKKGTVIVIPPNFPHLIYSAQGEMSFWEFIYIKPFEFLGNVYKNDVKKRNHYVEEVEYRPFVKSREEVLDLVAEIDLIMNQFRIREYGYRDCVTGLVYSLLMEIIKINHIDNEKPQFGEKENPRKIAKLSRALEYIEENYTKELRIPEIANAAYVSETYLRKLFAECCATSPMQYVKMIRIEAACKMIKNSEDNINEIAYRVGFDNMTTFINSFKTIMGCTPKQWKQIQIQNNKK